MKKLLIGSTGLIGNVLKQHLEFDTQVHSTNIQSITQQSFDVAICAAPSSNRIIALQQPEVDTASVEKLANYIAQAKIKKMILISSCDTQVRPDSAYGKNRLWLESFVKSHFDRCAIIRLPALIDRTITKNILYDLKNRTFLHKLNPHLYMQWYPLQELPMYINKIINEPNVEINLCSEPIGNWEIIEKFVPELKSEINYDQDLGPVYRSEEHTSELQSH